MANMIAKSDQHFYCSKLVMDQGMESLSDLSAEFYTFSNLLMIFFSEESA